jgi:organic hydroperoxide reductase OsmC/OhrA
MIIMKNKHQYDTNLEWTQGRKEIVPIPVLSQKINGVTPSAFAKTEPNVWPFEELLGSATSSSVINTFFSTADESAFKCNVIGVMESADGVYLVTEVNLKPILTVSDAADSDKTPPFLNMSQKSCLISNSVKSKVLVYPKIVVTT